MYNIGHWIRDRHQIDPNRTKIQSLVDEHVDRIKIFPEEYPGHDRIPEQLMLSSSSKSKLLQIYFLFHSQYIWIKTSFQCL